MPRGVVVLPLMSRVHKSLGEGGGRRCKVKVMGKHRPRHRPVVLIMTTGPPDLLLQHKVKQSTLNTLRRVSQLSFVTHERPRHGICVWNAA